MKMQVHRGSCVCVASLLVLVVIVYICATPMNAVIFDKCSFYSSTGSYQPSQNVTELERAIFRFVLNLEYLEAEWFLNTAFGYGLDKFAPYLTNGGPPPIGVHIAKLDKVAHSVASQFGLQEIDHITAIMETVGGIPRPLLNYDIKVWAMLMDKAFEFKLEPPFNPYEDSLKYLIATYVLPYVGLTGAVGGNPLTESTTIKRLLAALLAIESGQDAVVRAYLYARKDEIVPGYKYTVAMFTAAISTLRNNLGRTGVVDEGLVVPKCLGAHNVTTENVLIGDRFSLTYARTAQELLRILYGTGDESIPGAFYPLGANGVVARGFLNQTWPFLP